MAYDFEAPRSVINHAIDEWCLNARYREILKLRFLDGMTYDEIAEIFFISVNTVRYHIKKIYPKLDVSSSSQAIFKAKKIGLI